MFLRPYGQAAIIDGVPLITRGSADFKASPTLGSGDVKISLDGGAFANVEGAGTFGDFVAVMPSGSVTVRISLTSSQMSHKRIVITFIDTATKQWEDQLVVIETFGGPNAQHIADIALTALIDTVETADRVFDIVDGSPNDDEYNNMVVSIIDVSGGVMASRRVTDYDGTTKRVTVDYDFEFPLSPDDIVYIYSDTYSTTAGVAAAGEIRDTILNSPSMDYVLQGSIGQKIHARSSRYV